MLDESAIERAHAHHAAAGHAGVLAAARALAEAHPLNAPPALLRALNAEVLQRTFETHAEAKRDWLAACAVFEGGAEGGAEGEESALSPEQLSLVRKFRAAGAGGPVPPPSVASRDFARFLRDRMVAAGATVLDSVPCFTQAVLKQHGLLDRARLFEAMIGHASAEERERHPQAARREHHEHHTRLVFGHRDRMAQLGLHGVLEAGMLAHEGEVDVDY